MISFHNHLFAPPSYKAATHGFRYQLSGDADVTLEHLHECLKRKGMLTKKQAEVHAMLGRVYLDRRDWVEAERHLGLSCKKEDKVLTTWMALSELYSATDR
jgi:uncharacterized protein HemY